MPCSNVALDPLKGSVLSYGCIPHLSPKEIELPFGIPEKL